MTDSSSPPSSSAAPPPQQGAEVKREDRVKEAVHRTKLIQFFGQTTPIILQNMNGPCPLLAICNVLSLKNSLNLSLDILQISQEKLLSLVAERLIDSNSNINNKDAGYVENQQKHIADAIDLLPRLTTGIDVNIRFTRIDDFESTSECAIFDLLDIPLYHGWIVDPQDSETADAIGSKSYNTLTKELVSLERPTTEREQIQNLEDDSIDFVAATTAALGVPSPCLSRDRDSSSVGVRTIDKLEAFTSSIDGSEPLYEGEECIVKSRTVYENREPIYEGESVLAGQVDKICMDDGDRKGRISSKQGELIKNFMNNSASQLTLNGLFCLQDKVKERELCVFFRNNHFNTMFKYEGELYILVTDEGYINQPDLIWEKMNEVNGDTLYMTGNFKEFKMDDHSIGTWDQQNAMDYLPSIDSVAQSHSSFNSDLQLAIALQEQEFEKQQPQQQESQQPQPQHNLQQPAAAGGSRLVIGPQVSHNSGKYKPSSSKQESKSKEKCIVM